MRRATRTLAITIAVTLMATLLTATAVVAAGRERTGIATKATDTQLILWRTGKKNRAYTTKTTWDYLPMPSGGCVVGQQGCLIATPPEFMLYAKGPISLTFSGMFSRAPVELRIRDGAHLMRPGRVNFSPGPGNNAFSFTFVSPRKGKRACEGPSLEWRSPTGKEVRLNKATIVVHYKKYEPDSGVACL